MAMLNSWCSTCKAGDLNIPLVKSRWSYFRILEEPIQAGDESGIQNCSGSLRTGWNYRRVTSLRRYFKNEQVVPVRAWSAWLGSSSDSHIRRVSHRRWLIFFTRDYNCKQPEERRLESNEERPEVFEEATEGAKLLQIVWEGVRCTIFCFQNTRHRRRHEVFEINP